MTRPGFMQEIDRVIRREIAYEAALRLIATLPDSCTLEDARRTARDMIDLAHPVVETGTDTIDWGPLLRRSPPSTQGENP